MRLAFVSQDLEKFISVNFRRGLHMSLAFHLFEHGSYVISLTFEFQHFNISHCLFLILWFLLFVVRYSSNPLAKRCHFGHVAGTDDIVSNLRRTIPAFTEKNREQQTKLSQASSLTLRELITNGRFESNAHTLLRKLDFYSEILSTRMQRWCMTIATNNFVGSENIVSSSWTWRWCFLCHPFNRCPSINWWSENW